MMLNDAAALEDNLAVPQVKSIVTPVISCAQLFATLWTAAHQASVHGIFQARILDCHFPFLLQDC